MQPGETITITITGNIKSGKTTIARIITNALRDTGLWVGVDGEEPPTPQHSEYYANQLARLIDIGTRVNVEENVTSMHSDERRPIEARVTLRPDGTYTILRKP